MVETKDPDPVRRLPAVLSWPFWSAFLRTISTVSCTPNGFGPLSADPIISPGHQLMEKGKGGAGAVIPITILTFYCGQFPLLTHTSWRVPARAGPLPDRARAGLPVPLPQ